jgi:hypothetical protein
VGTTYTRQSSADITDGSVIEATHFNNEFDQLQSAFASSTGHSHDGTTGEGGYVPLIADSDALNKILVDTSNNRFGIFTEVTGVATEQFRFQDGAIVPVTDNDIDLGTGALEFKDLYLDGTANIDTLVIGSSTGITSVDTDLSSVSASDDTLASAKAIKTYIDAQVTAQDLDFQADTGGALSIDLDSESLTFTGGTGIDTSGSGNAVTFAIDSTVATLTGTQTLTNKTIDTANNTITVVEADISDLGAYITASSTDTLTNKTIDTASNTITIVEADISDLGSYITASSSDTLTNKSISLTTNTLTGTTAEFNTALSDGSFTTLAGTETLTNKTLTTPTLTSPVLNTSVSGTAFLDDDTFATASATTLASSESIKAYVDSSVATANELSELTDTNITSPADGALLFYDTGTSKWIDNVVSGDITIADTGVAAISSGVIVNADINASAGIDATKIAGGTVDNTEFGYLNGVTSAIQTQLTAKLENLSEDTTPQLGGNLDTNGNDINFGDNDKAVFGASNDLQIYHDGSNSYVRDAGTGNLRITSDSEVHLAKHNNEYMVRAFADGAVELYYDGGTYLTPKLATTSTGIQTTGTVNVNGAYSLPTSDGTSGQILQTDGLGNVSFATPSAAGATQGFAIAMAVAL